MAAIELLGIELKNVSKTVDNKIIIIYTSTQGMLQQILSIDEAIILKK